MSRPALFLLHALGSSARQWDAVIAELSDTFDCVALDIPGFGDNANAGAASVTDMVDWLTSEIRGRQPASWYLVGHSMGGKLATLVAARARDATAGLPGLEGVVLMAGSPPSPEPMGEDRRQAMLAWTSGGHIGLADAQAFIDANTASPLGVKAHEQMIADLRRCAPEAWQAWLREGSREDLGEVAGRINVPALIIAGSEDGDLGEDAQRRLNLPHYPHARVEVVKGAAHLLPLEKPGAMAALIAAHAST